MAQAVPQRVQRRNQGSKNPLAIMPTKSPCQIADPILGCLRRVIEIVAQRKSTFLSRSFSDQMTRHKAKFFASVLNPRPNSSWAKHFEERGQSDCRAQRMQVPEGGCLGTEADPETHSRPTILHSGEFSRRIARRRQELGVPEKDGHLLQFSRTSGAIPGFD